MRGAGCGDCELAVSESGLMSFHIALLRAVNVGGHNKITMADLCKLLGDLGMIGGKSLLQSGNLVFQTDRFAGAALERLLEVETAQRLNVSTDYLVRSAEEWDKIIARNPFPKEAKSDPARLHLMVLKCAPTTKSVEALRAAIVGRETLHADGKQLYVFYPDGMGRSKLTNVLIERKLETRSTARNWNTVLKLAALCQ
jgi:uncharacterized protein (DUF1697 family)